MAEQTVDPGRRRFLTLTTAAVGAVGVGMAAVPFYSAWKPSARAIAAGAPTRIDISKLETGQQVLAAWRKRPIFVIRRSEEALRLLDGEKPRLKDPDSTVTDQQPEYARNGTRSVKPEVLVVVGSCTHLGCSPKYNPDVKPEPWDAAWKGGYFCPCHNSKFDLAGRVYIGSPAPTNLVIPPHRFEGENDSIVVVGEDPIQKAA
jgi:ubiquinol-cytochrome c reductase iron-sulfur subunit